MGRYERALELVDAETRAIQDTLDAALEKGRMQERFGVRHELYREAVLTLQLKCVELAEIRAKIKGMLACLD